ncbi:MAG: LysM peptidoglycan-binding domain-containing protein, partial [Chloroflexi bacterium]|nr:LysM peptidoglycan-binding domain-containing protein [Chloroflexota bacterium]
TAEAGGPSPIAAIEASSAGNIVLPPVSTAATARPETATGAGTSTAPAPAAAAARNAEYVVQAGDMLLRIAAEHAVDLDELLQANALDARSLIQPGQVLRIP